MIWLAPAMRQPWITLRPTPPQPKTAHVEPGVDLRRVDRRADTRRDAAADQRCLREGDVAVDDDGRVLVHEGVLGEGAEAAREAKLLLGAVQHRLRSDAGRAVAEDGPALLAHLAHTAVRAPRQDDVVAYLRRRDAVADRLHDAGALVAEDEGEAAVAPVALEDVPIRVADAAGVQAHKDFVDTGLVEVDLFDDGLALGFVGDGCLHGETPQVWGVGRGPGWRAKATRWGVGCLTTCDHPQLD